MIDSDKAPTGPGGRRAQRQRSFVTRTYLSPILLGVDLRRMGERYVHVGKVRSRSATAGANRADARAEQQEGARPRPPASDPSPRSVVFRFEIGSRSPAERPAGANRTPPPPEDDHFPCPRRAHNPGATHPDERTAHGRTGPPRDNTRFSLEFRGFPLIVKTRCRAPMCADPLRAHGSASSIAASAVIPHDSAVLPRPGRGRMCNPPRRRAPRPRARLRLRRDRPCRRPSLA